MSQGISARQLNLGANDNLVLRVRMDDRSGIFEQIKQVCNSAVKCRYTVPRFVESHGIADRVSKLQCDITLAPTSAAQAEQLIATLNAMPGVRVVRLSNETFLAHLGGKIETVPRLAINSDVVLGRVYTPGVAQVCMHLFEHPEDMDNLTGKGNKVLIVSDGSRILALGNIGMAGLPVMEGKACLFKAWGGVNAEPMILDTQDVEEFIFCVKKMAKNYGGINLEDIKSPECWEIERRLQQELDIPVFHDDQHGTAIVVLAGTVNACKVVRKRLANLRVVLSGVGAAGMACARLLHAAGVRHFAAFKKEGGLYPGRTDMNDQERWLVEHTKSWFKIGPDTTHTGALKGADMFLGLSGANLIQPEDLKVMRRDAIVFPLANPVAEVDPDGARKYARIVGTGSSEYENQINNALVFPGFFRGALDARVRDITIDLKLAAARALANVIPSDKLRDFNIIPSVFDENAHEAVADAVTRAAHAFGLARRWRKTT